MDRNFWPILDHCHSEMRQRFLLNFRFLLLVQQICRFHLLKLHLVFDFFVLNSISASLRALRGFEFCLLRVSEHSLRLL